jgi:hypothetical protein
MKVEGALPCWQDLVSASYLEPNHFSPHTHILFEIRCNIILSQTPSCLLATALYIFLVSPQRATCTTHLSLLEVISLILTYVIKHTAYDCPHFTFLRNPSKPETLCDISYHVTFFLHRGVISACPSPNTEDQLLSVILSCSFDIFESALYFWRFCTSATVSAGAMTLQ